MQIGDKVNFVDSPWVKGYFGATWKDTYGTWGTIVDGPKTASAIGMGASVQPSDMCYLVILTGSKLYPTYQYWIPEIYLESQEEKGKSVMLFAGRLLKNPLKDGKAQKEELVVPTEEFVADNLETAKLMFAADNADAINEAVKNGETFRVLITQIG